MGARTVTLSAITVESGTDKTLFVSWTYKNKPGKNKQTNAKVSQPTDKFEIQWLYQIQNSEKWFSGSSSTVEYGAPQTATYDYPDNAVMVKVRVKPVSKTYKIDNKDAKYFSGDWKTKTHKTSTLRPDKPSEPNVEVLTDKKYAARLTVTTSDTKTTKIEFELYNSGTGKSVKKLPPVSVKAGIAMLEVDISAGINYRTRCRGLNGKNKNLAGDWSDFADVVSKLPGEIPKAPTVSASSRTSMTVRWQAASHADSYTVQYTQNKDYFDRVPDRVSDVTDITATSTEIFDLDPDYGISNSGRYYFRVKAIKGSYESGWSPIAEGRVGTKPDPPTTWSSSSSGSPGDVIYLYWTHNSVDGSRETKADLYLVIDGVRQSIDPIVNRDDQYSDTGTHRWMLNTASYPAIRDGAVIKWKVRTMGGYDGNDGWSGYSIEREINIYAPPILNMTLSSDNKWQWDTFEFTDAMTVYTAPGETVPIADGTVTKFPIFIELTARPMNQTPVTYSISIVANETYTDVDEIGNRVDVEAGTEIYNRLIVNNSHEVIVYILPSQINLFDGVSYTVNAILAMDSGLGAEASEEFLFDIDKPEDLDIDADYTYDEELCALSIAPYCTDDNDDPILGYSLSLYRRQADGSFIEIASGLPSELSTFVIDPHPTLGYASYRITATNDELGTVYFTDIAPYPIPEKSIIIQWDEEFSDYSGDAMTEDEIVEQPITASMLKLPYNIDVQDVTNPDVSFVNYIGRKHPVSYYGTSLGQTGSWSCEIPKDDTETISKLRRLAAWMGDVYVREPSGLGYWAQVVPSFNLEHCKVTVPVSFAITRVEGGV